MHLLQLLALKLPAPDAPGEALPRHNLRRPHPLPVLRADILLLLLPPLHGPRDDPAALEPSHRHVRLGPDQVRDAVPRAGGLRARRRRDAVHVAPQHAAAPPDHGVAQVDERAAGLRPHVAPVAVAVLGARRQDLQAPEDVEEHRDGADVRVAEQAGPAAAAAGGLRGGFEEPERGAGGPVLRDQGGERVRGQGEMFVQVREQVADDAVRVLEEVLEGRAVGLD